MAKICIGSLAFFMFLIIYEGDAASVDSVGRDFVFAYPTTYYSTSRYSSYTPSLYVVITTAASTECTATIFLCSSTDLSPVRYSSSRITKDRPANASIAWNEYFGSRGSRAEKPPTIRITSTGDVSVFAYYSYNQRYNSWYNTGMIVMPVTSLGTIYYTVSYKPVTNYKSEFTVSALSEETKIQIRGTDGYRNTETLQPYHTFQYRSSLDLTGSSVNADKPVSVVSGVSSAKVPDGIDYASYFAAHMPSVDGLGSNYILSPFKDRTGYIYRVVGTKDNSFMTIADSAPIELHAGELVDKVIDGNNVTMISSTSPVLVCQFSKGYSAGDGKGNAAMVVVPAIEMFASSVAFPVTTMPTKSTAYYSVSVTIKCDASPGLLMDGITFAQLWDTLTGPKEMCILRRPILTGQHMISHNSPDVTFSVMVYASAYKIGYAYMAGYNVRSRAPIDVDNSTLDIPATSKGMLLYCDDAMMTVYLNKSLVVDGHPADIHLNDPYCFGRLVGNKWIRLTAPFSECGTVVEEDTRGSIYKNTLIYDGPKDETVVIGRDATFNIPLTCTFNDRALASLRVAPQLSVINSSLSGYGSLANVTFSLQMFHTNNYQTAYTSEEFPVAVHVGKPIFLQAMATGSPDIQLMVETCLATHSIDPRQTPNYIFIDNGCPTDETVKFYSDQTSSTQRFSTLAFTLNDGNDVNAGNTDVAYIHCWLLACNASESSSRCQSDCKTRERRKTNEDQDSNHYVVSWGPLIVLHESTGQHEHDLPRDTRSPFTPLIVGIVFFLVGVATTAFGTVVYKRTKRTQRRPSRWHAFREDTYELLKTEETYE